MLIWTHRPSVRDSNFSSVGTVKYLCARKGKYGLNCQAVCDVDSKFHDISITYPGSPSDCLAFEGSALHSRLENNLLHKSLCLFSDNAYVNTPYMATAFSGGGTGSKDLTISSIHNSVSGLNVSLESLQNGGVYSCDRN